MKIVYIIISHIAAMNIGMYIMVQKAEGSIQPIQWVVTSLLGLMFILWSQEDK